MTRRGLMLASVLILLSGCATVPPPILAPSSAPLAELEPLYSATARGRELTIRVASNGCTTKADFAFYVERQGEAVTTLAFGRKRVDPCRSLVAGHVDLSFSYEELGLKPRDPVFLLNPLVAWRGL